MCRGDIRKQVASVLFADDLEISQGNKERLADAKSSHALGLVEPRVLCHQGTPFQARAYRIVVLLRLIQIGQIVGSGTYFAKSLARYDREHIAAAQWLEEARNMPMYEAGSSNESSWDLELHPCLWGGLLMENSQFGSTLARKLNAFLPLTSNELKALAEMQSATVTVKRGKQLTNEGQTGHKAFVLQAGWACSYKELPSGSRQIISFPIAGDCVGLRSVLLKTADHSFSALTDAIVSPVEGTHIMKCVTEYPRLGAALLWAASRDEAMVVEHLVNVGRRSAIERTAHFFMELAERLNLVGLVTEAEFKCPLSQYVLADALGLTPIHINRVLRQLRERDLLTLQRGNVKIHDLHRLRKLAGFEGGYLNSRD